MRVKDLPDAVPRVAMARRDLLAEALSGIMQRPMRSTLTAFGTLLGVAVLIAVLGLTSSASAQISSRFDPVTATEVSVTSTMVTSARLDYPFMPDAEQRALGLRGVRQAGTTWNVIVPRLGLSTLPPPAPAAVTSPQIIGATAGFLRLSGLTMTAGAAWDPWHDEHQSRIVLIGPQIARTLGISTIVPGQALWLGNQHFTLGGIIANVERHPELLSAVVMPSSTAIDLYGNTAENVNFTLATVIDNGAGDVVGQQLPYAANPDKADTFTVVKPPDATSLRDAVNTDLNALFFMLAGICLVIGMVSIANITFVAVVERTEEIGLRRALGARRRDVLAQFMLEALTLGFLGGLVGASVGILAVVGVCLAKQWTSVLDWRLSLLGPLVGAIIGGLAGAYPAWQATQVQPSEALRRS